MLKSLGPSILETSRKIFGSLGKSKGSFSRPDFGKTPTSPSIWPHNLNVKKPKGSPPGPDMFDVATRRTREPFSPLKRR